MPFAAYWSGAAPGSCFFEVRIFGTFVAIFVQATKRRAQIRACPILPGHRLTSGRQLFLRCIPSRLALCFQRGLALHQYQSRNLFPRTSRWLLLEEPYSRWVSPCSWCDGEKRMKLSLFTLA